MMQIAFSTIACPAYTLRQMAAAVRQHGYDGIELYALEGQRLIPNLLAARLREVQQQLAGIPIVAINSWGTLSSVDGAARRTQEAQIIRAMELASALGCPLVKTFGGELPAEHAHSAVFDYMADSIRHVIRRARELGITLVVETHDGFCRGAAVAQLLTRVEDSHFAALWDVHHPYRMGEDVVQTDHFIGARVRHVHVKDAIRAGNDWQFTLLGAGELPVQAALDLLAAREFDGYVAVDWEKMWHPEIHEPAVALPHYAAMLRTYIESAYRSQEAVTASSAGNETKGGSV